MKKKISLKDNSKIRTFDPRRIYFFRKVDGQNYVEINMREGVEKEIVKINKVLIRNTIKSVDEKLPKPLFIKIDRSTIVNILKFKVEVVKGEKALIPLDKELDEEIDLTIPSKKVDQIEELINYWNDTEAIDIEDT